MSKDGALRHFQEYGERRRELYNNTNEGRSV
jgi:hypothetical protein